MIQMATEQWHPGYATVHEIARIYGRTPAQIYRLGYKHNWRKYTLDGRVRYHRGDVDDTLSPSTVLDNA